jgi:arginine:ornithine antiporter/lysine permease
MAAEVLFVAAKDNDMPKFLSRATSADVPVPALLLTTLLIQVVLFVTLFSEDAFNFALDLTSALSLIPFLLAAAFAVKVALALDSPEATDRGTRAQLVIAVIATIYTGFLLYAAGLKFVLVSFIVYAPATILFIQTRRERGRRWFSPREGFICAISIIGAAIGVFALATGQIEL